MERKRILLLLVCFSLAILLGCETTPLEQKPVSGMRLVKDATGKSVSLPKEVEKAVSLAPNLTEIVFELGAGDRLVGATTFCTYPEDAKKIKRIGDTLKPNIESIVALKPDVVLVSTASQLEAFADTLEKQNIAVFVTNPDSLEGVETGINLLGEVFNKNDEAEAANKKISDSIKSAKSKIKTSERVFVQIDPSLYTIGKGSFISDLLNEIGLESVTDDIDKPYPKISKERARVLDPDLIIISQNPGNEKPNSVFEVSKAVKNDRILKIDADILARPGPRLATAAEKIAEFVSKK